jgi:hypothetical protein
VSATSVAITTFLGFELPSASLFEGPPEETLPEAYGPGEPEEADDEATDEGVMDVTNAIFREDNDDVDEEQEDFDVAEEENEKEVAHGGEEEEQEQEGGDGAEEEEKVGNGKEEEEQAVVGLEAKEEQPVHGTEVENAAMVMQAFGVTSLVGVGNFFSYIFPDVVETSSNLAVDAAGVAGHTAPESADAGIPAPDLAQPDAGEAEETRPQVVADAPSQLIREICNCGCLTLVPVRLPHGQTQGWLKSVPLQLMLGKQ